MRILLALPALAIALHPAPVFAQETLSDLVVNLYFTEAQDAARNALAMQLLGHPDQLISQEGFDVSEGINSRIAAQVASLPLGSATAGFTWTFAPDLGTQVRTTNSFGPTFTERALTVGRNRFSLGVNYQRATYDTLDGQQLGGGDLRIHNTELPRGFLEDEFLLKVTSDTAAAFATYGVTDRLDLGVTVPIIHVGIDATLTTRYDATGTGVFPVAPLVIERDAGSSFGVGDVVARAKYNFFNVPGGGLSVGVDWRLPTGDEFELLGLAGYQARFLLAASTEFNKLSPHVNFGFTVSGESEAAKDEENDVLAPPGEVNYAGGVDVAVTPRLTVVADMLGRTLLDSQSFLKVEPGAFPFARLTSVYGSVHQLLGTAGVKFSPVAAPTLISANVLFPLNDKGLIDNLTWMVGVDFGF